MTVLVPLTDLSPFTFLVSPSAFLLHPSRSFQSSPVIVKLVDPPGDPTGLTDVLIGALGLTGVIVALALVSSVILAGVMFWLRSRQA